MLLQLLCTPFFALAKLLLGLIPRFPQFDSLSNVFDSVAHVMQYMNQFISLQTVGTGLLILLVVYNLKFGWSIFMWLLRKIPGVS